MSREKFLTNRLAERGVELYAAREEIARLKSEIRMLIQPAELRDIIIANSSQNMTQDACERQAQRIVDALLSKGDSVFVPREALKFVLENANLCDQGPPGEGWSSPTMDLAVQVLEAALSAPLPQS